MLLKKEQMQQWQASKNKEYHLKLIKEAGEERAIKTIKKQLPNNMKLKEYLELLQKEITKK